MEKTNKIWNRRFVLLFITNLLVLAAFYASIPIIPVYCQQIGITGSGVCIVLTAMSVATVLFRPIAGYLLDNFNRYRVYLLFLAMFCIAFPLFPAFPFFGALVAIRLFMGAVYSVCGSATMTLAGDVLPMNKITEDISRFAFTISIGMAVGPFVGIQVQNHLSSTASFLTVFAISVAAFICVSCCRISYPKIKRRKFSLKESIYKPALPFMGNMMFLMIPYGAVIAYSSILAQEKGLNDVIPYFYICLVAGMLLSKLSTQKMIDAGKHRILVFISIVILILTMASYAFLQTGAHLLAAGFFFGLGYGILQPLFQSFVTGTTPPAKRGVANATYLLSYDIGIGIGSLLMGFMQESIGLTNGFALTAIAYVVGFIIYLAFVDGYYNRLKNSGGEPKVSPDALSTFMEREVYTLPETATVREALSFFAARKISGAPIVKGDGAVVGFISDGDIMRYLRTIDYTPVSMGETVFFMDVFRDPDAEFEQKLSQIMDLNVLEIGVDEPLTIPANASLEEACTAMSRAGVKKMPVVVDGKIVGIASRSAITRYLISRYLEQTGQAAMRAGDLSAAAPRNA
ncbi:MFS transporter [Candidatus Collinsella stercoripullorum]|uniref:MFS transporter n=1 Tax=Candidatus Collinsella stercoripullorum TaxID=2838522 RepID=UPI0022E64CF5|nr:MFS transporter [Candidatus Collinsella stercoripullorum]